MPISEQTTKKAPSKTFKNAYTSYFSLKVLALTYTW